MKKVTIKYNPYLVKTQITVDGKVPKSNSSLNVDNFRLQEWVENLPQILIDEYRDRNFEITFTGTQADFDDVTTAIEAYGDSINAKCSLKKTADIDEVEKTIDKIFSDIKAGPVPELKDKAIIEAFEKAKNSRFEINVVATMSSGKSTLINALLGKQLMPAANEATTATIVKIVDTDQDYFSAIGYDKSGNTVKKFEKVTLADMKDLNDDERVSSVEICGKIPFVSSVGGMKLVLVDTPGPNNSRDKRHEEMTYKMISDSDKSLVLYVMNGQQLGINDEKIFLDYVCQNMKEGGKQSRERFIFVVNKMDAFKPKDEGVDCIERALKSVKTGLEDRGIMNPNIFPVTAAAALEKRTDDDEPMAIDNFRRGTNKYEALHFDNYYQFSHLPMIARQRIEGWMEQASGDDLVEYHTGIVSIEQAISMYINKYARTTKACDLVDSFMYKLNDLAAVANLQDAIAKDKSKKAELEKQIEQIKSNLKSAKNAQTVSKTIDDIDLTPKVEEDVKKYLEGTRNQINKMLSGLSNDVKKDVAKRQCDELEKQCRSLVAQIKVEITKILEKSYKETINKILSEYKKHLAALNMGIDANALSLNPLNLVSASLSNLSQIIEENTETIDEGRYVTAIRKKRVEGGFLRQTASFLSFGLIDDHTFKNEVYQKWEKKLVDHVDMNEVANDYLKPLRKYLNETQTGAVKYVSNETVRLKEYLKAELVKIEKLLDEKLDALSKTEADTKAKAKEIAKKEADLKWLMEIQQRVKNIIEF